MSSLFSCFLFSPWTPLDPPWTQHRVHVIDVGQAVDVHHPHALDMLLRDLATVTAFFDKRKVCGSSFLSWFFLGSLICLHLIVENARSSDFLLTFLFIA